MSNIKKPDKLMHLFELFCGFDDYCRQHDITLILDRGTLIGAIRHRGFIPWDFDLDVSITWNDYLKLLKAWEEDPMPDRELVNWDRFPGATTFWLRFVDTTTTELRRSNAWGIVPTGMSIDVFLLIPIKDDPVIMQEVSNAYIVYYELMNRLFLNKRTRNEATKTLLKESLDRIKRADCRDVVTDELRQKALSCVDDPDFTHYYLTTAGLRTLPYYRREYFDYLTELPFEGRLAYAPGKYIEHIRTEYGPSWRSFPPGRPKEYEYIENLSIPYQVYEQDYLSALNQPKVLADFTRAKDYELEDVLDRLQFSEPMYRLAYERLAWHLEQYGSPDKYQIAKLPDELQELLNGILKLQLAGKVRYWHIWFGLDDGWLDLIFEMLWKESDFHRAQRLLDFRISEDAHPLLGALQDKAQRLKDILELFDGLDYRDADLVHKALMLLNAEDDHEQAIAYEARLFLLRSEVEQTGDFTALEQRANEYLMLFPESMEILSYHAYARARQGDIEAAFQEYEQVEQTSNNGMLLLSVADDKEQLTHD